MSSAGVSKFPAYMNVPRPPQFAINQIVRITNTTRAELNGNLVKVISTPNFQTIRQTIHILNDPAKTLKLRPINLSKDTQSSLFLLKTIRSIILEEEPSSDPAYEVAWRCLIPLLDGSVKHNEWESVECYKSALNAIANVPVTKLHQELLLHCLYEACGNPLKSWYTLKNSTFNTNAILQEIMEEFLYRERQKNVRAHDLKVYCSSLEKQQIFQLYLFEKYLIPKCLSPSKNTTNTEIQDIQFYVATLPPDILFMDQVTMYLCQGCGNDVIHMWLKALDQRNDLLSDSQAKVLIFSRKNKFACTLGERHERIGEHASAVPYYQMCIDSIDQVQLVSPRPDYNMLQSTNYGNLAIALKNSKQYELAESAYTSALNFAPTHISIHNYCTMQFTRLDEMNQRHMLLSTASMESSTSSQQITKEMTAPQLLLKRNIFSKTKAILRQQTKMFKSKKENVMKTNTKIVICNHKLDMAKLLYHQGLVVESIVELEAMRDCAPNQERLHTATLSLQFHRQCLKSCGGKNPEINISFGVERACAYCGTLEDEEKKMKKCGKCKLIYYCSSACQKRNYKDHKKHCVQFDKSSLKEYEETTTYNHVENTITTKPAEFVADGYDKRTPSK